MKRHANIKAVENLRMTIPFPPVEDDSSPPQGTLNPCPLEVKRQPTKGTRSLTYIGRKTTH